jgi:ankyrin repeat protein
MKMETETSVNEPESGGITALMRAAKERRPSIVELWIKKGATASNEVTTP